MHFRENKRIGLIISLSLSLIFISTPIFEAWAITQLGSVPVQERAYEIKETGLTLFGIPTGLTLDSIVIKAAKLMLERISDSTVEWINSGFKGGPAYIRDTESYFQNLADIAAGSFIRNTVPALCSPFRLQIEGALRANYQSAVRNPRDQIQCTFTDVIGNLEQFLSGNFDQGGWRGWFQLTQTPTNNPYGAVLETQSRLSISISSATGRAGAEATWNKGFLTFKGDCQESSPGTPAIPDTTEEVTLPDGSTITQTIPGTPAIPGGCVKYGPAKTPGSVIESQLENVLGSGVRQLELADEFDEIVGALIGQLVSRTVFAAQGLLSGSYDPIEGRGDGVGSEGVRKAYCSADKTEAIANIDAVTWTAQTYDNSAQISWAGDEGLSGTNKTATITYTTGGSKYARITVTDKAGTSTVECDPEDGVKVSPWPPLSGWCRPNKYTVSLDSTQRKTIWFGTFKGGSGQYDEVYFDLGGERIIEFPLRKTYNWIAQYFPANSQLRNQIETSLSIQFPPAQEGEYDLYVGTLSNPGITYLDEGNKSATLRVIDKDPLVRPLTVSCEDSVTVY